MFEMPLGKELIGLAGLLAMIVLATNILKNSSGVAEITGAYGNLLGTLSDGGNNTMYRR